MTQSAIDIRNLSKRYKLGGMVSVDRTFREMICDNLARALGRRRSSSDAGDTKTFWALKDVTFDVDQGEVMGVIGRNGAGKSTLLKILSRITDPTEGTAAIRGRVASLLEVGTGFHPELSGRENIYLNGAILGMRRSEIKAKFDQIVQFSGVSKFLDTPVKRYSSGMKVRLAFAVAAHLDPEILIVDEVLAVGDAEFQRKCLGKMREVASGSGRTVLFVSHNMPAVRMLCDRAVLLDAGRVADVGPADAITQSYLRMASDDADDSGHIEWSTGDAPGGEEVRLRAIRLRDSGDNIQSSFDVAKPIAVQIDYDVCRPLNGMRFVLKLIAPDGAIAFTTTDHLLHNTQTPPGRYRSTCTIPANLLNIGKYTVRINAGCPGVKEYVPGREYLQFTTQTDSHHGSLYQEHWPGAVSPAIEWAVQSIDPPYSQSTTDHANLAAAA